MSVALVPRALVWLACACAATVTIAASAAEAMAFPVEGDIRGTEVLLAKQPAYVVIGEIHGTAETPPLVATFARTLSNRSHTELCLEIAASEQGRLDAFLKSDGSPTAFAALVAGPHWSMPDGRGSQAYLSMLQLVRQLVAQGQSIRVCAIDADPSDVAREAQSPMTQDEMLKLSRQRDRDMAANVLKVAAAHPRANLLVLVGNVHASTKHGAPWDAEYDPMAWHLKQKLPGLVSLNTKSAGGQAWVMSDKGIGPTDYPGTDRGKEPFVELFEQNTNGYDGLLYIGHMTASPPVKPVSPSLLEMLEKLKSQMPRPRNRARREPAVNNSP